jgi:DNA-binding NtrC family response regulator
MTVDRSRESGHAEREGGGGEAGLRVLLIDDEEIIRVALRRFFSRLGWRADEASDGDSALRIILSEPPVHYDAIISDLRMPGLSGVELHDRLATLRPELLPRLIVSTGDRSSRDVSEFVGRTSCIVLEKPFELARLREAILRVSGRPSTG